MNPKPKPSRTEPESTDSKYSAANVLVVEDSGALQGLTLKLLGRLGVKATALSHGADAVAAAQRESFDLILMDCQMPKMDGYEATRRIREPGSGSRNQSTPIVALTANAAEEDEEKCLSSGMNDYLCKSSLLEGLQGIVEKWLCETPPTEDSCEQGSGEASNDGESVFDLNRLKSIFGEDEFLLKPLVSTFIESLSEEYASIGSAVEDGVDLKKLRLHSHTVKGASANFGASALQTVAGQMEDACIECDSAEVEAVLPELKQSIRKTIIAAKRAIRY